VAQVIRIERQVQQVRKGEVIKESHEVVFGITSYLPEEASPPQLLELARDHWSIENGQFHRRDRTQREDWCTVSDPTAARNLSLFRSLAIFLFKAQATGKRGKKSLPDFQSHVHCKPWGLIRRLTEPRHEE
jgi:hypothetical protein